MGEAKNRLARFRALHPICCFCGGATDTATVDHLPPKAMFIGSEIPKKFDIEFPACDECNNGSKQLDQAASMIALTLPEDLSTEGRRHFQKLLSGVANNANSIVYEIKDGFSATRHLERVYSEKLGRSVNVTRIGENTRLALRVLTAKMGLAYFYKYSKQIVSKAGAVVVQIITNSEFLDSDGGDEISWAIPFVDASLTLPNKNQFLIRCQMLEDNSGGIFQFAFHLNLLCVAIVVTDASKHPVDMISKLTFRPGFIANTRSPPNVFRTALTLAV